MKFIVTILALVLAGQELQANVLSRHHRNSLARPLVLGTRDMRAEANCGIPNTVNQRITGGWEAGVHEYPWQAAIYIDTRFFCGGTLLSEEWVLTSASCVQDGLWFRILLGAHDLTSNNEAGRLELNATEVTIHPDWDPRTLFGDVALIRLPQIVTFSDSIRPICLPEADEAHDHTGELVITSGWGRVSDTDSNLSPVLRKVNSTVISITECEATYGPVLNGTTQMCMSGADGKSTCAGDNGGPLSHLEEGTTSIIFEQIGVLSFGAANGCTLGYPVGFSNMDYYLEWVSSITNIAVTKSRKVSAA